jgi:hypothetical protein
MQKMCNKCSEVFETSNSSIVKCRKCRRPVKYTAPKKKPKPRVIERPSGRHKNEFPDLSVARAAISTNIPGGVAPKRNKLTDHLWRKDLVEKDEEVLKASQKSSRVAPAFNKGPVMYLSDSELRTKQGKV